MAKEKQKTAQKAPQLVRTAMLRLDAPLSDFAPTIAAYTTAYNIVAKTGFDSKISNAIKLHQLTYRTIQNNSLLPSQLICSARNKASESLKAVFTQQKKTKQELSCPSSDFMSISYDARSYSINFKENIVSLATVDGRKKIAFTVSKRDKRYLRKGSGWRYTSAELCYHKRTKQLFLHIVFQKDAPAIPERKSPKIIGADRGQNNLLTASNGKNFGGQKVKERKEQYQTLRTALQKCGSKSAKRHLRKVAGKEKRFQADVNHCISKAIVAMLSPGDVLVLENLRGIRRKAKRKGKAARRQFHSWAFFQLEQFLLYKLLAKGVMVLYVDPAYTSQECPRCKHTEKGNRNGSEFCCKDCDFKLDADLIGAWNIAVKGFEQLKLLEKGSGHSAYRLVAPSGLREQAPSKSS